MPEERFHAKWGHLSVDPRNGSLHTRIEVNRVPVEVAFAPPASGPLDPYLDATWILFDLILQRLDVAIYFAAEVVLAAKIEGWFDEENEDEEIEEEIDLQHSLSLDSVVFAADRSFTIWFAADPALSDSLIRVEGTPDGNFIDAGF